MRFFSRIPLRFGAPFVTGAFLCMPPAGGRVSPSPEAPTPTLVVFITVDQLLPDYLDRYRRQFTGGLARMLKGGAIYTDAHQDHAITETAPGHASVMSGRFPSSTGITRNLAGVGDPDSPLIGSDGPGASPYRFRGTTLTDWLIAKYSGTRALSVSTKDRGAILPIGRSKQQVYWYAPVGLFTTSTWYRDSLPDWVRRFNARRIPHSQAGKQWPLLLPEKEYAEPDAVEAEGFGRDNVFPHPFPTDSIQAAKLFPGYPMMDEAVLQFALEGLGQLGLGKGPDPDVLAVSLSTADYVGHRFGPDSREIHDQVLRLDRYLGAFIDSLFKLRDSSRVIFALTADHGVAPIPELAGARFKPRPLRVQIAPAFETARAVVRRAGADTNAVDFESGAFYVDGDALGGNGLRASAVVDAFVAAARLTPGVLRVDRFAELAKTDTTKDAISRRWLHMFPPDMKPQAVVTLTPGSMYNYALAATHGSPHDYDSHVPVIFYGPPFAPARHTRFTRTVDIGPTLAWVLGITRTERLDGRALMGAIR